jgi:hypothetical protein
VPALLSECCDAEPHRGSLSLWFFWVAFNTLWTAALLVPDPDGWARSWLLPADANRRQIHQVNLELFYASKVLHVTAYAALAFLSGRLRLCWPWQIGLLLFIAGHAVGTEWLQNFIRERHPSWRDIGLDCLGAACGILLYPKAWLRPAALQSSALPGRAEGPAHSP